MKTLLLFFCISFCLSLSFSQPLLERVLSNEIKLGVSDGVRFDDGSWIFSAFAYSLTPGDSAMALVIKTDSSLKPLWTKRYKYLRRDDFSCITSLADGNLLVGGTMRQDFSLQDGGSILKLDTAGNVLWHLMYEEDFDDRVLEIFEQADSSLMVFIREGVNNQPTKVVHANKDGGILSQRTYSVGNNLGLLANMVVADESENYYFSGTVFHQGTQELFVCSVDDNNLNWYKRYRFADRGVSNFSSAYIPADQSIILGGTIADTVGLFVNIWLTKIDLLGNLIWTKEYGQDLGYSENVSTIKPLTDGNFMIFGSVFDDQGSKGFAAKLDSMGNKVWERAYDPTQPTVGIGDAFFLPDGRILLNANSGEEVFLITTSEAGVNACSIAEVSLNVADLSITDTTYSLTVSDPGVQIFIPPLSEYTLPIEDSLLCAGSVGISELSAGPLEIFPNPAHDQLTIVLPESPDIRTECIIRDAVGRKIIPIVKRSPNQIQLDISTLPTGFYWVILKTGRTSYSQSFVRL